MFVVKSLLVSGEVAIVARDTRKKKPLNHPGQCLACRPRNKAVCLLDRGCWNCGSRNNDIITACNLDEPKRVLPERKKNFLMLFYLNRQVGVTCARFLQHR